MNSQLLLGLNQVRNLEIKNNYESQKLRQSDNFAIPRTSRLKEHDVTNRTLNTNDFVYHGETNAAMVVDERCSIGD